MHSYDKGVFLRLYIGTSIHQSPSRKSLVVLLQLNSQAMTLIPILLTVVDLLVLCQTMQNVKI